MCNLQYMPGYSKTLLNMNKEGHTKLLLASVLAFLFINPAVEGAAVAVQHGGDTQNKIVRDEESGKFLYYVSGFDYENRPVIVMEWGKWNFTWLQEHEDRKRDFQKGFKAAVEEVRLGYFVKRVSKGFINETKLSDDVVFIIDFDGLDVRQFQSVEVIKLIISTLKLLQRCYAQTAYGFLVNANPLAYQLIAMAKPLMGNFLERAEIFGTNSRRWKPQILKRIPPDQLSPPFGGSQDFKPVAVQRFFST